MPATSDRQRVEDLVSILEVFLSDPVEMPGWSLRRWRLVVARPRRAGEFQRVVCDARMQPLLGWVGANSGHLRRLGAVAAAMAALDGAAVAEVPRPGVGAEELAAALAGAVSDARPLGIRPQPQSRVTLSANMDLRPSPSLPVEAGEVSPFVDLAADLLRRAGCDLALDERLALRLGAALDVAVDHWLGKAVPGEGLPAFPSEGALRSDRRLTVLLGRDRDLRYLVYGPQPGRGRPLQAACRRGLAYWVAMALVAAHTGQEAPTVPKDVLAHWRLQLARIGSSSGGVDPARVNSLDVPSA